MWGRGLPGRALAGESFGVHEDSIRHWCSGRRPIPPEIWARLRTMVDERVNRLQGLQVELTSAVETIKDLWDKRRASFR